MTVHEFNILYGGQPGFFPMPTSWSENFASQEQCVVFLQLESKYCTLQYYKGYFLQGFVVKSCEIFRYSQAINIENVYCQTNDTVQKTDLHFTSPIENTLATLMIP